MPLHFEALSSIKDISTEFSWIVQEGLSEADSVFKTWNRKYWHIRRNIMDGVSGKIIGAIVYTMKCVKKTLEILDIDIVWNNPNATALRFIRRHAESSDANEYYEAEIVASGQHLEVETVNRHVIPREILNTERDVFACAFPFEVHVFEDMTALNAWAGFRTPVTVRNTDMKVDGLSETFVMSGRLFNESQNARESFSFLIGTVTELRNVMISFGDVYYPLNVAHMETALGVIPVVMSRDVFDLDQLKVGSAVYMYADIKVDLAQEKHFKTFK